MLPMVCFILFGCSSKGTLIEKELGIVPYPKEISVYDRQLTLDPPRIGIGAGEGTEAFAGVIRDDIYRLCGVTPAVDAPVAITLSLDKSLADEEYTLDVNNKGIKIKGGSYAAVSFGWSTVLQAAETSQGSFAINTMEVRDFPDLSYRGFMLDLVNQFHEAQTVKHMIDLARWNKINYLHLHLNDNARNVFPTKLFPKSLKEGEYYTQEQMRDIIEYAEMRGLTVIPEVDGPGHSRVLREAYPEIFGDEKLMVVNLASDKAIEAMKQLSREVFEMFPNSPYYHIGADEVCLTELAKLPEAQSRVKERGYKDVHDLYLEYIVTMHELVKSMGKQTLVWEGFGSDSESAVKIPKDIIVCVFETLYQRPDSLARQGFRLINTSWEPIYVVYCPRWMPDRVYDWNYYTWDNWWDAAPAGKEPIVLDDVDRKKVMGGQFCSWELGEDAEYPALSKRLATFCEVSWDTLKCGGYSAFDPRLNASEEKFRNMAYPFEVSGDNFTDRNYNGEYHNWENYFAAPLTLSIKSRLADAQLRYTTDGSFPTASSPLMPDSIILSKSTMVKVAQYAPDGRLLSYSPVLYENKPVKVELIREDGGGNDVWHQMAFVDSMAVRLSTPLKEGTIRYTLDGSVPTARSRAYTSEFTMDRSFDLRVRYFGADGQPVGEERNLNLKKR